MLLEVAPVDVEYLPAPQLWQVLSAVAPIDGEYLPAPQLWQDKAPVNEEYLPAPQLWQVLLEAIDAEYLPASQNLHASFPASSWYLPTSQSSHPPLSGEYLPGGQFLHLIPDKYLPLPQKIARTSRKSSGINSSNADTLKMAIVSLHYGENTYARKIPCLCAVTKLRQIQSHAQ